MLFWGVPYYNSSIMGPKTPFEILLPLHYAYSSTAAELALCRLEHLYCRRGHQQQHHHRHGKLHLLMSS